MTRGRAPLETNPVDVTQSGLPDGLWRVDPQHSEIGFAVKDIGDCGRFAASSVHTTGPWQSELTAPPAS